MTEEKKKEETTNKELDDQAKKTKIKEADKPKTPGFLEIKTGMIIKVHQKIREKNPKGEEKERIQVFEGTVIARKHGRGINSTITVRKISNGVGVEKIFPMHLPTITKIEVIKEIKKRKSKLYYLRNYKKRLKTIKVKKDN